MISYKLMEMPHVAKVAELEAKYFSMPWSENSICGELKNPLSLWVVALKDGEVVGYVGSQIVPDEADMMNLAVEETYHRKGIAEGLVNALVSQLQVRGVVSLTLEVRASNAPAIALYNKMGFFQVGRRPNYYQKPREDALILRKEWAI